MAWAVLQVWRVVGMDWGVLGAREDTGDVGVSSEPGKLQRVSMRICVPQTPTNGGWCWSAWWCWAGPSRTW